MAASRRQGPPGGLRQIAAPGQLGDDYSLLFDPVQRYNYFEALQVGRVLDEYGYVSFEDPIPITEMEALVEFLIADNIGGIAGSFRVGQMADAFGMPCTRRRIPAWGIRWTAPPWRRSLSASTVEAAAGLAG